MALAIKRSNRYLRLWLAAETMEEVSVFNKLGREYNRLYNKYLKLPAISVKDNKYVASLALYKAKNAALPLPLPEYSDDNSLYKGNLPILQANWSSPEQTRKVMTIAGIGSFRIAGDTEATLQLLDKVHKDHYRRNRHLSPQPYCLDPICVESMSLASVKSLGFDIAPSGADFCIHINY